MSSRQFNDVIIRYHVITTVANSETDSITRDNITRLNNESIEQQRPCPEDNSTGEAWSDQRVEI